MRLTLHSRSDPYNPAKLPRRRRFLPFALPDLDESELEGIRQALDSGWITSGPKVSKFEAEFAVTVGFKHAVAVNSCTAAMHLALEAIGLQRGDEVITTPYTFAATAEVIRYFDATPVFVDILPETLNINPALIESAITPRTRAIIPVHIGGLQAEMSSLHEIAAKHRLAVIEDAAHADPIAYGLWGKSRRPNTQTRDDNLKSTAACFSFYATKTITTGEGGMICTDDDTVAQRCRIMALHGISKDAWKRYTAEGSWYYEIIAPGYKYNMTDIAAAMGLAQLRKAERMLQRRKEIAQRYTEAFSRTLNLEPPTGHEFHSWHLYMLRLRGAASGKMTAGDQTSLRDEPRPPKADGKSKMTAQRLEAEYREGETLGQMRGRFIAALKARNIGASVHFIPLHIHPYYRETYGYKPEDFPVAYREYLREVSLPIYSRMSDDDVADVITAVQEIAEMDALS